MLYFNRNGVSFKIPIAKDAVYDHDLLENRIKVALNGLQNLKDRSLDIEQLRHEVPGRHIVKSAFGRDEIIINPLSIGVSKKPKKREIKDELVLPLPIIDVYDGDTLVGFDVSQFFKISACEYFNRYLNDSGKKNIADFLLELQENDSKTFVQIDELEAITDIDITSDTEHSPHYWSSGYLPPFGKFYDGWECKACGGDPFCGACAPTDTSYENALIAAGVLTPLIFAVFDYGPGNDTAKWFQHAMTCKPSGSTPCGQFIGGNIYNSGDPCIHSYAALSSSFTDIFLCGDVGIRQFSGSFTAQSHYYACCVLDLALQGGDIQSSNAFDTVELKEVSRGISDGSRYIYCWSKQNQSGSWEKTLPQETNSYVITSLAQSDARFPTYDHCSDSAVDDNELWNRPISLYVSVDYENTDYLIYDDLTSYEYVYFSSEIYDFSGDSFYMYSLYLKSYYGEEYSREEIVYGCIYLGDHHRLKFESLGYDSYAHGFDTAIYISPSGAEKEITFGKDYEGLTGKINWSGDKNFRAGKIYKEVNTQQVVEAKNGI